MAVDVPYILYVVKGPLPYWWSKIAEPFLTARGWYTIRPANFSFESSYGFDANLRLAMRWFLSSLREFESGRALVEVAMNWVCLESQARLLNIPGNKYEMVNNLITNAGFSRVPHLRDFYLLRNDAFHDGELSHFDEPTAQIACKTVRSLTRAFVLHLLGMNHPDFETKFVASYS